MIGFVYILTNPYFASDVYKVGCTERAPHARAEELSKGTGIPAPFEVLCYLEIDRFQEVERNLHAWLKNFRISENREFFEGGIDHAIAWMWWHPQSLGFHGVSAARPYTVDSFMRDLVERELVSPPNGDADSWSLHDLPNPFEPKVKTENNTPADEDQIPKTLDDFGGLASGDEHREEAYALRVVGGKDL